MAKRKRKNDNPKPKRPTAAERRVGIRNCVPETTTDLGPNYRPQTVKRHRGPVSAGAVPNTGKPSASSKQPRKRINNQNAA